MFNRSFVRHLSIVLLGGFIFCVGLELGSVFATQLGLAAPPPAPGAERNALRIHALLTAPLLVAALAWLSRQLAGAFGVRAAVLAWLTWLAAGVNDQLEGLVIAPDQTGFWFSVIALAFPSLLVGGAVAWFFPPATISPDPASAWWRFWNQRAAGDWLWRLLLAGVIFAPVYFVCGLLVMPFVAAYYEQGLYGLQTPAVDRLMFVLFLRSVLFCIASLPVIILWRGTAAGLALRLGLALFVLVAWPSVLIAYWLPLGLRAPHAIEILAGELGYAGILAALLRRDSGPTRRAQGVAARSAA